jgi:hypothetical protein
VDSDDPDTTNETVRIDADAPTKVDRLNREDVTETLADVIEHADTPLVIALYGSWGTGKTSMMLQIKEIIENNSELPRDGKESEAASKRTVWFDPWRYQHDDNPALALLHATADQLGIQEQPAVRTALLKIARAMAEDVQLPIVGMRVGKLLQIRDQMSEDDLNRRTESAKLTSHFETVLQAASAAAYGGRVVYFIDYLDRCQPKTALRDARSLEALSRFSELRLRARRRPRTTRSRGDRPVRVAWASYRVISRQDHPASVRDPCDRRGRHEPARPISDSGPPRGVPTGPTSRSC